MLLCYKCARKIFSSKAVKLGYQTLIGVTRTDSVFLSSSDIWKLNKAEFARFARARGTGVNMNDPKKFGSFMEAQDEIQILGIVQRLRRRGLRAQLIRVKTVSHNF